MAEKKRSTPVVEVWLSTDMKNTVRLEIPSDIPVAEGKLILARAEAYFNYLLEKYGTKQATGAKEYKKPVKSQSKASKPNWKVCKKHGRKYDANKYDGCYYCSHPEEYEGEEVVEE